MFDDLKDRDKSLFYVDKLILNIYAKTANDTCADNRADTDSNVPLVQQKNTCTYSISDVILIRVVMCVKCVIKNSQ